jgi:hypothetical protein
MEMKRTLSILMILVAVSLVLTACLPAPAQACTANARHIKFKAAQETARTNLQSAAQMGAVQAPQIQPAPTSGVPGTYCYDYSCVPYWYAPSYNWNVPATAGGVPVRTYNQIAQPQAPPSSNWPVRPGYSQAPTSGATSVSYSTWWPCATAPQNSWNVPATSGARSGATAAPPAQPVNTGGNAAPACYQVWWPQCWGGPFSVCWGGTSGSTCY